MVRYKLRWMLVAALLAVLALVLVYIPCGAIAAAPEYMMVDLGALGENRWVVIRAVSNTGFVAGEYRATESDPVHAFVWRDGVLTDLGTLGGQESRAYDVNDLGQVVGESQRADGVSRAFIVDALGSALRELPIDNSSLSSRARAITNLPAGEDNTIVGVGPNLQAIWGWYNDAYRWIGDSYKIIGRDIEEYGGMFYICGEAFGVNDSGWVVGSCDEAKTRPWLYLPLPEPGAGLRIGEAYFGRDWLTAIDINNHSQIIADDNDVADGKLLDWNTKEVTDLSALGLRDVEAINDRGDIVGGGDFGAALYHEGVVYDLNDLTPNRGSLSLAKARDINDLGWIVGFGEPPDSWGVHYPFLLVPVPVPEPGSLAMLTTVVVTGLLFWKRHHAGGTDDSPVSSFSNGARTVENRR